MPPTLPVQYWIGPYRQIIDPEMGEMYAPPEGFLSALDLRHGGGGSGFFCLPENVNPGSGYTLIGSSLDDLAESSKWQDAAEIDADGDTMLDRAWSSLTDASDPDGITGPRPLMPTSGGILEIQLQNHSVVRSERYTPKHSHEGKVEEMVRRTYQNASPQVRAKLLGAMRRKLGMTDAEAIGRLIPRGEPRVEPRKPTTTFSDDFNRANSSNIGANWTEYNGGLLSIVSNELKSNANTQSAIWNTSFSADDMYAQVVLRNTLVDINNGTNTRGVVRYAAPPTAREVGYSCLTKNVSPKFRMVWNTANTYNIFATTDTPTIAQGDTIQIRADGSTISARHNGSEELSATDTNITGNLDAGVASNNQGLMDDWLAEDIVAASSAFPFQRYYAQTCTI